MKLFLASLTIFAFTQGSVAVAANSAKIQPNLTGLMASENDPNLKQGVARNETTGGVVKTGFYCATCGKWITNPPIQAATNPDASLANVQKQLQKETGRQ